MTAARLIIAGPSANCGKTALACSIVAALRQPQALKITRFHRESHCPVHGVNEQGDDNCDGCAPAPSGFELITNEAILCTPGKDTDRLLSAGAEPVLWLRAAPHVFRYALNAAMRHFDAARPLLLEGNSAATVSDFAATVVVIWPQSTRGVKASVIPALRRADALVLVEHDDKPRRRLPKTLRAALERNAMTESDLPSPLWLPARWWQLGAEASEVVVSELLRGMETAKA